MTRAWRVDSDTLVSNSEAIKQYAKEQLLFQQLPCTPRFFTTHKPIIDRHGSPGQMLSASSLTSVNLLTISCFLTEFPSA